VRPLPGFARFNGAEVFVSRGVGSVDLPGRLFAEPDVLVLDLERAAC
jgi:predicted MPP superfamily phosphohydrolase